MIRIVALSVLLSGSIAWGVEQSPNAVCDSARSYATTTLEASVSELKADLTKMALVTNKACNPAVAENEITLTKVLKEEDKVRQIVSMSYSTCGGYSEVKIIFKSNQEVVLGETTSDTYINANLPELCNANTTGLDPILAKHVQLKGALTRPSLNAMSKLFL